VILRAALNWVIVNYPGLAFGALGIVGLLVVRG